MSNRSFVGGVNLAVRLVGQRRVAFPLARFRVGDDELVIGTFLRKLFLPGRASQVEIKRTNVKQVFPTRGLSHRGVGIETTTNETHYFWTLHPNIVLAELAGRAFPVGEARRLRHDDTRFFSWPRGPGGIR